MSPFFAISLIYFVSLVSASSNKDLVLSPGEYLPQGQTVHNDNGTCYLELQRDGNLIVRKGGNVAWSSGVQHDNQGPFYLELNLDGALMIKTDGYGDLVVFDTKTRGTELDGKRGGGLFFNPDCTLSVKASDETEGKIVWTNINSYFRCGNELQRGGMFRYPPSDPEHTLLLQNDGNLVLFEGIDWADYKESQNIIWNAGVLSESADFFLKLTCDGRLVLTEQNGDDYVDYWSTTVESENGFVGNHDEYSLTLKRDGNVPFGFEPSVGNEGLILIPGRRLRQHQTVSYKNGRCQLVLQGDGNLVVTKDGKIAWSSGSFGTQNDNNGPFYLKFNSVGALVVKPERGERIFKTNTSGTLRNMKGGLFFNQDCSISIRDENKRDVWTNARNLFHSGNRLERGEMVRYPDDNPRYTLLLQNDGNLIMFEGSDLSDYEGPHHILWAAGVTSNSEHFFLHFTCDGQLVLKQKIGKLFVPYWDETIVPEGESIGMGGYSLVLQEHESTPFGPFGYSRTDTDCYL